MHSSEASQQWNTGSDPIPSTYVYQYFFQSCKQTVAEESNLRVRQRNSNVNAACVRLKFPNGQHEEYVPAIHNMGFWVYGNIRPDRRPLTLWKEMFSSAIILKIEAVSSSERFHCRDNLRSYIKESNASSGGGGGGEQIS